jgi:hypothetical protein
MSVRALGGAAAAGADMGNDAKKRGYSGDECQLGEGEWSCNAYQREEAFIG